ncbi:hypothetical protein H4582DRAFT_2079722 [Lactarius indigo]|nr:hypothetical protein H4582DRAFT_2079722 [Lactarius indigo]
MSSSASFSALLRATSPGHQAIINELARDDDAASKARDLRHASILGCRSVEEVFECIPSDYRPHCADILRQGYKQVVQLVKARITVAKWKHHLSVGTLPAHLRGSAPKIQFTAGYGDSAAAQAAQKKADDEHAAHQVSRLTSDIAAREAEVKFLEEAIDPQKAFADMQAAIAPHVPAILKRYQVPLEERGVDPATGEIRVTGVVWVTSPAAEAIRDQVLMDCGVYAARVIAIAQAVTDAESAKIEKKRNIASAATTAARDGDDVVMGESLSSAMRAEIKRVVMGLMPKQNKNASAGPSQLTKKARNQAAEVHAKITGKKPKRKYRSQATESVDGLVLAKAEGSQPRKKRARKGKGKGQAQPQQQQQKPQKKRKGKGKEKAT